MRWNIYCGKKYSHRGDRTHSRPLGYDSSMLPLSHSAYLQTLGFFKHYFTLLQNEFVLITDFLCKFYKEFKLIAIYQMFQ